MLRTRMLPINELYTTIQGEGHFTGTPAMLIRTQGCPVGCPWCDTKYTWPEPAPYEEGGEYTILQLPKQSDSYGWASEEDLVKLVQHHGLHHIILTGGEPLMHDVSKLCELAYMQGITVQIETSGTHLHVGLNPYTFCGAWITLSPKIGMPGGFQLVDAVVRQADELKWVYGRDEDAEKLDQFILDYGLDHLEENNRVFLQPLSMSKVATARAIEAAMKNGWRISIQVHKYLNLP